MNDEMIDITVWVATDRVGSRAERVMREFKSDWLAMSEEEKSQAAYEFVCEQGMFDTGYEEP